MSISPIAVALDGVVEPDDIHALVEGQRGAYRSVWPTAVQAADGDVTAAWQIAVQQGLTQLGEPELLPLAIHLQGELGRTANPVPVVDIALAQLVAEQSGHADVAAAIGEGTIRPVIAEGTVSDAGATVRWVTAAATATHLLAIDADGSGAGWFDLGGATLAEQPGIAVPPWTQITVDGPPQWHVAAEEVSDTILLRRVGLAARAAGAVARSSELAHEFATQRVQFGRPVGSYQAVSHRIVEAHIDVLAAEELLAGALDLRRRDDADWRLAAEVFIEFVADRAPGLQFDAHHTLAANGYFEEHEAPWLFRRVHADLAVLATMPPTASVGEALISSGGPLPDVAHDEAAQRIRREVEAAFAPWAHARPSHLSFWDDAARDVLRERDWIGVAWPTEVGGGGWSTSQVIAFSEALAYANPPLGNVLLGINSIAPMVIRSGSEQLRELVLTEIRRGDLSIALGYSEPEVGSDLASLRTRAERVEGGWRITGQKMWGTCFPDSKWILLAARTDPDAVPRHAGISLFLVDTDSPGLTSTPHRSLAGDVSSTTFWDGVFVPEERLVGDENGGWAALMQALAGERVLIGGNVARARRTFDRLVALVREDPDIVLPAQRHRLQAEVGRLAVRLQAARALVNRAVRALSQGESSGSDAAIAKIAATELSEDLTSTAVALLGPNALLRWDSDEALVQGAFEDGLRSSIMSVIAGGTGDIQRNIVARAIGLPK